MRRFRTYHQVEHDTGSRMLEQVVEQRARLQHRLARVRAIVAVVSGKGGVGKSALTANLAAALARRGARVGALDADLNGPSLGRMLGVSGAQLVDDADGVQPALSRHGPRVMSMDLLQEETAPVRWRGPEGDSFVWRSSAEAGTLREFLADVAWGELDYLLIDMPPGTDRIERLLDLVSDPHQVLLVTTPSEIARYVVTRSARLLKTTKVGCVGVVANMVHRDAEAVRALARDANLELWAEVPLEPALAAATDGGTPYVCTDETSPAVHAIERLADRVERERGGRFVA